MSEERKAAVLAELARILESASFRGSRRCCRLLEYSVHQVLKGSGHEDLKERTIGIEALQRLPDYDTSEDAVVRVTANEVRKRLAQYYQAADAPANPAIALPSGSYAATFHWLETAAGPEETCVASPKPKRLWLKLAIAVPVLLLLAWGLAYGISAVRTGNATSVVRSVPPADPLWSRVFHARQKTNIVISDTVYRQIQYFLGRDVSLTEYLSPGYPASLAASAKPEVRSTIAFLGRQQTTSVGSATLGSRLLAFGARMGGDPVIRYPRHMNAREFKTDNFILLGSRLSIPWEEIFEPSLNFPLVTDPVTHQFYLQNRAPRQGEQAEYRESDNQEETYADIGLLPNLSGTGTVLILNGIDMVAAEAAGEFAMDGSLSSRLTPVSGAAYFEILVRIRAIAGTAARTDIVAVRQVAVHDAGGFPGREQ